MGTVYRKTGGTTARPILKPIATGLPRPPGPIARPMVPPMGPGGAPPWASFPPLRRQRIARMIRRHKWMHARGYAFAGAIDATSGRYVPDASEILTAAPKPGSFYVPRSGIYPAKVADVAYGAADRKRGLLLMNASTWNDHVRRAAAGWEPYKVKGLQFEAKYKATDPRSTYGSGTAFPVIWVPPLDGREPEAVIVSPAPAPIPPLPPAPGGDPRSLPPITGGAPYPGAPASPIPTPPSGGGYALGRYVPTTAQILTAAPRPGTFYRPRQGIWPIRVAEVAYGAADRKRGVLSINASTWNDHVRRASKGWEAYKVNGLQFEARYGAHPSSFFNTGNAYPVIWVPPLDGREPEAFFSTGPTPIPPVPPPWPVPPVPVPVPPVPVPVPPVPVPVPPYPVPDPVPILPPVPPIEPPPVPPYVPPPPGPSGERGGIGGVLVVVSVLSALARLGER